MQNGKEAKPALNGLRVLIVEDEPFIAFDLADAIEAAGGDVVGPALRVCEAMRLIGETHVDAAILDVNLPDGDIDPVIGELVSNGVLFLIHSGAGLNAALREKYPGLKIFAKPTPPHLLARAIASTCAARATV